jgi:DNA-binding NarL/FixJ family response regulator
MHRRGDAASLIAVLVVDDHPAFLKSAASVIAASPGFSLAGTAASGVEALGVLADRHDIDLVLLDLNLPDLSGIEVARRRHDAGATEVIVLMSTTDRSDLPSGAFDRGVAGFLPKVLLTRAALRTLWADVGS